MSTAAQLQLLKNQEHLQEREAMLAGLRKISDTTLGFPTLEPRGSDELDFRVVSVWGIRHALEAAYNLGRASK